MPMPWFTSKGQIVQTTLAAVAPILAAVAAWQQIKNNQAFSTGFLLSYVLAALVIAVTIVANRRVSSIRKMQSAEIEALKTQHSVKVASLEERLAAYAKAESVLNQIWALKSEARDIKRRWPECLFTKAPLDRVRWSPFVGQPETGMGGIELEKAVQWHDKFFAYAKGRDDGPYPVHVDFDAVMAMLDRDERLELGLTV
jgi:hypothetical protein